jgi:hypothetical protein
MLADDGNGAVVDACAAQLAMARSASLWLSKTAEMMLVPCIESSP